jgi:hypothetical protein
MEGRSKDWLLISPGERPVCGTCTQNKHECAGYGDGNASDAREVIKQPRRESHVPAIAQPIEPPIDPRLTQMRLPLTQATPSYSIPHNGMPKREHEDDVGGHDVLSLSTRNRMPYFRYFGPTAIMPGFKQMVVKVNGKQHGSAQTTSDRTCLHRMCWLP